MADDFPGERSGGDKIPSWIWIVGGGGLLLLLFMKGGSKSPTATDNLLAAEIDANLKAFQETWDANFALYKEEQKTQWDEFKTSLDEMLEQRYGVQSPSYPTMPARPPKTNVAVGSGSKDNIPAQILGSVMGNYIMGFDYRKAKN